ncbi:MAG: HlyD family efflux transporter periplasmic adaptor subunit, partial [Planctomycetes bacterium]|nr:HlyD family efflux transporter periplasmic adaptor subunit [Planctomycetota bacterium]
MKNVIIFVLVVTTLITGFLAAKSTLRMSVQGMEGKTEKLIISDLTLPINATGEIRPKQRVEIKSEASGEVIEIRKRAGDRVMAGDILIRLQKDDEQRSVNKAKRDLSTAGARLAEAKINLKQAETADLKSAEAKVNQLQNTVRLAKFQREKFMNLPQSQRSAEETLQRETTLAGQDAQLDAAKAGVERALLNIPKAKQVVLQAQANVETAQYNLADAEKRLTKTDIVSPIDGIVADIKTQIGEVIQGGKTTLTGGTVLAIVLNFDQLLVRAEVDESDIGRVLKIAPPWAKPGHDGSVQMPDDVENAAASMEHLPVITVESFRNDEFTGVIERIYPESRNVSGVVTYLVDVVIISKNKNRLLPGMRADVRFTSEHASNVVLCPNEAIREGPNGKLGVYIPKKSDAPDEHETQF